MDQAVADVSEVGEVGREPRLASLDREILDAPGTPNQAERAQEAVDVHERLVVGAVRVLAAEATGAIRAEATVHLSGSPPWLPPARSSPLPRSPSWAEKPRLSGASL
jgi:hypothetical protein